MVQCEAEMKEHRYADAKWPIVVHTVEHAIIQEASPSPKNGDLTSTEAAIKDHPVMTCSLMGILTVGNSCLYKLP